MLPGEKLRVGLIREKSAQNLVTSLQGATISKLYPWMLSALYTYVYYLHANKDINDHWRFLYNHYKKVIAVKEESVRDLMYLTLLVSLQVQRI